MNKTFFVLFIDLDVFLRAMLDIKKLEQLRLTLPPVFEIGELASFFPEKAAPRKFCERLAEKGILIRLKKGMYAFRHELDSLIVANYLAPCSYISFETALSFYGMIPEYVPVMMSVSSVVKRSAFSTELGLYEYYHQSPALYSRGMDIVRTSTGASLLIATREKALSDTFARRSETYYDKNFDFIGSLISSLRIDEAELAKLDLAHLEEIGTVHFSKAPMLLLRYLKNMDARGARRNRGRDE